MPQISKRQIARMAGAGLRSFYLLSLLLLAWGCDSDLADRTPDGMVRVEAGTFRLGSETAERDLGYRNSPDVVREYGWYDTWEADPHEVVIGPFVIDRTPVTRAEYTAFVAATGHRVPAIDSAAYHAQGFLVHPWSEVQRFRWNGDRPPDGATPDGIQDLLGNVFEWTSSRMPPPESREPVLRGCGWDDAPGTCRCAFRHGRPATSRHILIGFRCAADLGPSDS